MPNAQRQRPVPFCKQQEFETKASWLPDTSMSSSGVKRGAEEANHPPTALPTHRPDRSLILQNLKARVPRYTKQIEHPPTDSTRTTDQLSNYKNRSKGATSPATAPKQSQRFRLMQQADKHLSKMLHSHGGVKGESKIPAKKFPACTQQ